MHLLKCLIYCYDYGTHLQKLKRVKILNKNKNLMNKILSVGYRFISEMYLRQPRFTSSASGPLTKTWK